ncbi:MAG: response regulator [Brevundimonas sp.]|uniref:response regulator n=1 Tax=Brevundimonas sp. TaxID=1871086 RepID=UPI0027283B68|nr:response regulator [Brevundimonas sp.]MDO9587771.1 response regulator [Brevundimonas sp.]MDP3370834.1 response regulator [Brevundimonas sp.]MDP3657972.1 response regulator [Brevundimonas sp.]MDZ4112611.1 response regulator [Brevundimonas sp.]
MFDGTLNATIGEGVELDRLRAIYDGLLSGSPDQPGDEAMAELAGMARIFDLDADRPPADVWRDLRAVLMRHGSPVARRRDAAPPPRPLTVMVVEDDPGMASELTELLAAAGHGVVGPFSEAAAAGTAAALHTLDLALLDINLAGDGDGVVLARHLKETWGVPVIFLTGNVAAAAENARLATALVLKPYGGRDVMDAIARTVASGAVAP